MARKPTGKVVLIVQARMGSERLPGKVMKLVQGRPLLQYVIEQLKSSKRADELVIATSTSDLEQPIVDLCRQLDIPSFRGSLNDVLARYAGAASAHQADTVVRICADCPLIDPVIVDEVIDFYGTHEYDYVSNILERRYPRGQDVEVFSHQALSTAAQEAQRPEEREHVTPYLYRHPEKFRRGSVAGERDLSAHRWVVDTKEDFELISKILHEMQPVYHMEDVLKVLQRHPDWIRINAHVEQRKLGS